MLTIISNRSAMFPYVLIHSFFSICLFVSSRLTEAEVRYYLLQLIEAVKFMHLQRIIHRDLKLGNLFLSNMEVKIGRVVATLFPLL